MYATPIERVPSKVDQLIREASEDLEAISEKLKLSSHESGDNIRKLEQLDKARQQLVTVDLLLKDCYTILAGYNKALAEIHVSNAGEQNGVESVRQGGSGNDPTEGNDLQNS